MNLDERMTEETKEFVKTHCEAFINAFKAPDLPPVRDALDKLKEEQIQKADLSHLNIKEYLVPSTQDNYQIPVTTYVPKNASKNTPIVVFCHGGGWCMFSRKVYHLQIAHLATQSNFIWVSIEYRLAPEAKHPTQINDCCSVLKWVSDNKTSVFGSDRSVRLGICGDSAGGHLAASVALRLKELLSFQILIYPVLDFTMKADTYKTFTDKQYFITPEIMETVIKHYFYNRADATLPDASPLLHTDFSGLPKCLIISAELDPLVGDAYEYVKKFELTKVDCEFHVIKGTVHGFFHSYLEYKIAFFECTDYILKFLKSI